MTSQAIIFVNPDKNKDLLFKELNGKIFLHYQLNYLSENLFKKVVFIEPKEAPPLKSILGENYLDMELVFIPKEEGESDAKLLIRAFEYIDDIYAFIFDAHHFFRLNLSKSDDFRRMRDTKILLIGRKSEEFHHDTLPHLQLNEKGRIEKVTDNVGNMDADTFFTDTWLINKIYFQKLFGTENLNLFEILKSRYQEYREFCFACRQYFIEISSVKDLEKAENDIKEYHYQ